MSRSVTPLRPWEQMTHGLGVRILAVGLRPPVNACGEIDRHPERPHGVFAVAGRPVFLRVTGFAFAMTAACRLFVGVGMPLRFGMLSASSTSRRMARGPHRTAAAGTCPKLDQSSVMRETWRRSGPRLIRIQSASSPILPNGTVDWRGWPNCGRAGNRIAGTCPGKSRRLTYSSPELLGSSRQPAPSRGSSGTRLVGRVTTSPRAPHDRAVRVLDLDSSPVTGPTGKYFCGSGFSGRRRAAG
jgi:hypothetical protein